jgi:hypothetical protein
MKPTITLLFIIITFGCKKEKVNEIQSSIIGKWELSRRWGTLAGIDESFPAGNGAILEFQKTTSIGILMHNSLRLVLIQLLRIRCLLLYTANESHSMAAVA